MKPLKIALGLGHTVVKVAAKHGVGTLTIQESHEKLVIGQPVNKDAPLQDLCEVTFASPESIDVYIDNLSLLSDALKKTRLVLEMSLRLGTDK